MGSVGGFGQIENIRRQSLIINFTMATESTKTKTIAKNAVFLYIRMIIVTFITLFTSRVVLRELGIEDYGLYNVVGGVVALFAFLRSSMNSSTQRFLSYEMGKGNSENLRNIFSTCLEAHILISLILLTLAETVGLWFLNTQLVIPEGRQVAANWIYQFSVISLFSGIVSIPYSADIISNEKMGYFAFLGVLDAVLKLVIAYMITISPGDRLVFYGFLMMLVSLNDLILNWIYCHVKFRETHFKIYWDKESFKKVFSFSGWTIWGQLAVVGANQGTNILVNLFYTVTANAAMGVGAQVNNAITGLVSNFQTAFKPQITKSYAENDTVYLNSLIKTATKISFVLMIIVTIPIIININFLLSIWLDNVPTYAAGVCAIFLLSKLPNALSIPLQSLINATGIIKGFQIVISIVFLFELALMYTLFKLHVGLLPCLTLKILANFMILLFSIIFAKKLCREFDTRSFLISVIAPSLFVTVLSITIGFALNNSSTTLLTRLLLTAIIEVIVFILCYRFCLNSNERKYLLKLIKK